jgi:hypothetical protein
MFGVMLLPWLRWWATEEWTFWHVLAMGVLALAFPFPFYCYQSVLMVAKSRHWVTSIENPELHGSTTWIWRISTVLALLSIACLVTATSLELSLFKTHAAPLLRIVESLPKPSV